MKHGLTPRACQQPEPHSLLGWGSYGFFGSFPPGVSPRSTSGRFGILRAAMVFLFFGSTPMFCQEGEALLQPRLLADFKDGEPALSIAPGEKRLGRAQTQGSEARMPPYNAMPGKRISLKETVERDARGNPFLVPKCDMNAAALGAMNMGAGTLAGWFREGRIFREGSGRILSAESFSRFPDSFYGEERWQLGVRGEGEKKVVYATTPHARCSAALPLGADWVHIAAVWDENHGVKIYLNGELAGSAWQPEDRAKGTSSVDDPIPADRLHIHADPEGGIRDLQIFDAALSAVGVRALYQGDSPRREMAELSQPGRAFRLNSLGWNGAPASAFLKLVPGSVLTLRQAPVLEAKENLMAAGWRPVSGFLEETFPYTYKGYKQGVARELRLEFGENIAPNWMVGSGDFQGILQSPSGASQPLKVSGPRFGQSIEPEVRGTKLSLIQKSGSLSNLSFYETSENGAAFPGGGQVYSLREAGEPISLPKWKKNEFYSVYTPGNRLVFDAQAAETAASTRTIPAFAAWHIVSPPMSEDYFLGKIGLRIRTTASSQGTRARAVIHDAFSPWRELARLDFLLEPSTGKQGYDLVLDLRDTLIAKGDAIWITVTLDQEAGLLTGKDGTELALFPAEDKEKALALWKDWELRSVRDRLELLSEPRPWQRVGEDEESRWWLPVATSRYEQLDRSLRTLRERFPEDRTIQAWYSFTHPLAPSPVLNLPLPEAGDHPEWAVLTRECLRLYRQFVDFWIDRRQHPNGEFGNNYGDDTDLVQDWLDLILISDPHGKVAESLDRLARGISTTFVQTGGGRDGISDRSTKGRPILENGLNLRFTDALHAYEEGVSIQPADFIAHYGDPEKFQRLLDTVSRYDGFILTPETNGIRRFVSQNAGGKSLINTYKIAGDPDNHYWHLFLHAGLVAAWYNNDPEIWSMLEAVAKSELIRTGQVPEQAASLLQAMFSRTRDMAYLSPFIDSEAWKQKHTLRSPNDSLSPNTYLRVAELDRKTTFEQSSQDAADRYTSLDSSTLGFSDNRHLKNWLEWRLTGDESHLLTGLRALDRQLAFLMPAYTTAEQSGDRVSIPKQLISQLYLGGVPGSRNRHFYPDFAISYRGLDDNFAARVLENSPRSVQVLLYSFDEKPVSGEIVVWTLEPGEYKITQGPESTVTHQFLRRADSFPITLPPRTPWLVSIEQESRSEEPAVLGDAAVSAQSIHWENGVLRVPIYNLGAAPLENTVVRLRSKNGQLIAEKNLGTLPGMQHWKLGKAEATFAIQTQEEMHVEVDGGLEITKRNNRAAVPTKNNP